jgi:asparagine synthase (glutamine-hydrolysing)
MCGIAGIIDFDHGPVAPQALLAMNRVIAHRGPDDEGYVLIDRLGSRFREYSGLGSSEGLRERMPVLSASTCNDDASVGLCHRRFSIIDLSEGGHQPFFDSERSCSLVFNGEIYNYLELRDLLSGMGVALRTQSDTEVLIEAYKQWGVECFSKFNGFWALALYDFREKRLILSRDRIGKRPFYWTRVGAQLFFASEIKALLQIPEVSARRKVNDAAIYHWLAFGQKDLDSTTCFEGIQSLPAGSWAFADPDFPNGARTFWSVPSKRLEEADISIKEAASSLRTLLEDAVSIRLRADVPLSVELSGGMDSSTLVAIAANHRCGKITTYTVRFPEKESNEEPFARSVARRYGTEYRVLESPIASFWNHIFSFTYLEEEPYHSPNLQTNQVIWSQMRAMGTKVSLNGAGGDENFAGYSRYYLPFQVENLLRGRFSTYMSNALRYSQGRTNIRGLYQPIMSLARSAAHRLSSAALENGAGIPYYLGPRYRTSSHASLTLSETLLSDMTNTLMPYWLRSGDRGYMGIPLEVRAPFLDYRVIELAFRLPVTYLFREGWHKWILRKAVEDILPTDVVWRRQKMGFPFPFDRFYAENQKIVDFILANAENPLLDLSQRDRFRADWKTLSFILWYELFFNENTTLFHRIEELARQMHPIEPGEYTPEFFFAEVCQPCS